tara:strand:- start:350 stop:1192 length:843 start_codon:yes stop_codon:yes gene_type:complete
MIKKIYFLFFLFSFVGSAQSKSYKVHKDLPLEFVYLIKSYQNYSLNKAEEETFKKNIDFFEITFSETTKPDLYNIIKSQTYKTIINFLPLENAPKNLDPDKVDSIFLKKVKNANLQPFSEWIFSAFYKDFKNIIEDKSSANKRLPLNLFFTWLEVLENKTPNEIQLLMKGLSKLILSNIKKRLNDFILFSDFKVIDFSKKIDKRVFFIMESKKVEKKVKKSKILEILAPVSEDSLILPGILKQKEEWLPKEENINISPPKPDPNYIPPKNLPSPVNDWGD